MTIEIAGISKTYGSKTVVSDISFSCAPGTITGFLGPNGAGKSTTLRILVGMTRPDTGSARIDGLAYHQLSNPARSVGVLLDAHALHPGRTGRETCRAVAQLIGAGQARADTLLESVGLAEAATKQVRKYSMGMRQRLGLAVALMGEPTTLILDEPVNGMDPAGIAWIRSMLIDFAAAGGTVLLSSHILNEVQATVDHLVILNQGRTVVQGTLAEIAPAEGIGITALNLPVLIAALKARHLPFDVRGEELRLTVDPEVVAQIIADEGIAVTRMAPIGGGRLEDLFLNLTESTGEPSGNSSPSGLYAEATR